ncbi:hypothetical protein [Bartonella bovis]|uniref:hypothetical protein n=1 Tax=Bartonella bovis TaxID=155194 RepID=UPI0003B6694E|nr:hypothetical protein [Bartonella bovis]
MHVGRKQSWKTGFLYQLSFWHACVFTLIVLVCFFWPVQSIPQNAIQFFNHSLTSYYGHSLGASSAHSMGPSLPLSMGPPSGQSLGILGAQSVIPSLSSSSMGSFSDHGLGTLIAQNMGPSLPRSMDPSSGQSLGTSSAHSMDPPLPPSRGPSSDQSLGTLVAQSVGPSLPRSMDPLFVHVDAEQKMTVNHQDTLLKGKDLDLLLRAIQGVLERDKRGEKEERLLRQHLLDLFNQDGSFYYYCPLNNPYLEKTVQVVKGQGASSEEAIQGTKHDKGRSGKEEQREKGDKSSAVDVMGDEHKGGIKAEYGQYAKRGDEKRKGNGAARQMNGDEDQRLLPKGLYKKGYDFILSANYAEAEKVFCAFQKLYKQDPLVGDAVFWLAESLLGQERYHEAAQVYLYVWYTYKDTLYGSEILLKLAMSVAALGQNKAACDVFADIPKHYQTLECVFCKRLKQEQSRSQCSPN